MTDGRAESLAMIAEVMGEDMTARLVARFGGLEICVPCVPSGRTWQSIAEVIGERQAAKFVAAFAGESLYIARDAAAEARRRRVRAVQMARAGHGGAEIARALGITRRRVNQILAEARDEQEATA